MTNPPTINPSSFFDVLFVIPILNLLLFFYHFFSFFKFPGPLGFAIIGLTIFVSFLIFPLNRKQKKIAEKLVELRPKLEKIQKKYKNDKARLQAEQLKLYREVGVNPGLGCLIPLIQLPFFIGLYNVLVFFLFNDQSVVEKINKLVYFPFLKVELIDPYFLGFNLVLSPQKSGIWFYLLIPIITGLIQYLQFKLMSVNKTNQQSVQVPEKENSSQKSQEDFQKIINLQMKILMPILIGWFSYSFPIGLSLYWNIFSILNLAQNIKLTHFLNR
ncbi:MAG: YidC/Oxa1 family membrane protein insertase [Patescibacteria group bacterium]|nr:YidC/Oxa1 family membrane protein insertase [Patescibacteria group bacterium]